MGDPDQLSCTAASFQPARSDGIVDSKNMKRIAVVGTVHEEKGLANVPGLLAILKRIKPELMFLEIPSSAALDDYVTGRSNLESAAVGRYRAEHVVDLVPVDLPTPEADFFTNNRELFERIERTSPEYRRLVDWHRQYVRVYGFAYLNSEYCSDLFSQLRQATDSAIELLADQRLAEFYALWIRTNTLREEAMVKNIENHCHQTSFSSAAFLVGAAHRRSILTLSRSEPGTAPSTILWEFSGFLEEPH